MTLSSSVGLAAVNILIVAVGMSILWMCCGWRTWGDVLRAAGLGFFVGLSALIVVLTAAIVIGVAFSPWLALGVSSTLAAVAVFLGRRMRRSFPRVRPRHQWSLPRLSFGSALWACVLVLYFEVLLLASNGMPAWEWDAKWVWTIRAKALVFFGDLGGDELVRGAETDYASYPPGLSLLHALAFEGMSNVDAAALHVQHWLIVLAFAAAAIGALQPYVGNRLLLPLVTLCLAMPLFVEWSTMLQADLLLAFQGALAASALFMTLEERRTWQLASVAILMSGMLLTKREGFVFVAAIVLAGLAASWHDRRWAWPRVLGASSVALFASAPWWWIRSALGDSAPSEGFLGVVEHRERVWPAAELVGAVFVDQTVMVGMTVLIVTAIALRAASREGLFLSTAVVVLLGGIAALLASEPSLEFSRESELNPVERLVLVCVVMVMPLVGIALQRGASRWSSAGASLGSASRGPSGLHRYWTWGFVALAATVYPLAQLAFAAPN